MKTDCEVQFKFDRYRKYKTRRNKLKEYMKNNHVDLQGQEVMHKAPRNFKIFGEEEIENMIQQQYDLF